MQTDDRGLNRGGLSVKIGVISDTHDLLRPEVTANLQDCSCILHGGDISSRKILERLERIAPVRAVRGNNDKDWAENLPSLLDLRNHGIFCHKKSSGWSFFVLFNQLLVFHTEDGEDNFKKI